MKTTATNWFEDLLELKLSMSANPYVVIDDTATNGRQAELPAREREIISSRRWDKIPAMGLESDIWFSIEALRGQSLTLNDQTREMGLQALDAAHELAGDPLWVSLDKPNRMAVADFVNRSQPTLLEEAMTESDAKVSLASVQAVSNALASFYLTNAGFTTLTYEQISIASKVSRFTVRTALNVLSEAGIWGAIKGSGKSTSRFYPLFASESMDQFSELVGG